MEGSQAQEILQCRWKMSRENCSVNWWHHSVLFFVDSSWIRYCSLGDGTSTEGSLTCEHADSGAIITVDHWSCKPLCSITNPSFFTGCFAFFCCRVFFAIGRICAKFKLKWNGCSYFAQGCGRTQLSASCCAPTAARLNAHFFLFLNSNC